MAITATSVAPVNAPGNGLTPVTITGTGFSATTTAVLFGGQPGTNFTRVSATSITVVPPALTPGSYPVVVVDSTGNATVSGGINLLAGFYVINPLELPSFQPAAALFSTSIVDPSGNTWSQSPATTPNWQNTLPVGTGTGPSGTPAWTMGTTVVLATSVNWPDATIADRTLCAQAALAVEQARLQAAEDQLNSDIATITATP